MAAKSKKRLSKSENKLLKLEHLSLADVLCSICHSILVEPVTLPCFHDFCRDCFNGSVENNALCCPLCRTRIGSWLRKTKPINIVNLQLWNYIQNKFSDEVSCKLNGQDLSLPDEKPIIRLSEPGEIRTEYEKELERLRLERLLLEKKHSKETESLIKKLQEEEDKAQKEYLDILRHDEILAREIAANCIDNVDEKSKKSSKINTIDGYIVRKKSGNKQLDERQGPSTFDMKQRASPELVPSYGTFLKDYLDRKLRHLTGAVLKKETIITTKPNYAVPNAAETSTSAHSKQSETTKQTITLNNNNKPSVSKQNINVEPDAAQPTTSGSIPINKIRRLSATNDCNISVDSMRQELCYFKPIQPTVTSLSVQGLLKQPLRVRAIHKPLGANNKNIKCKQPTYNDHIAALKHLRTVHTESSAFVCLLHENKEAYCDNKDNFNRKTAVVKPIVKRTTEPIKSECKTRASVRKSMSTGNINKLPKENTPRKYGKRSSSRKVKSDSKIWNTRRNGMVTPLELLELPNKKNIRNVTKNLCDTKLSDNIYSESNNNKPVLRKSKRLEYMDSAALNVDLSPLKRDAVIIAQQLEAERKIEQERRDFELAKALQWGQTLRSNKRRAADSPSHRKRLKL